MEFPHFNYAFFNSDESPSSGQFKKKALLHGMCLFHAAVPFSFIHPSKAEVSHAVAEFLEVERRLLLDGGIRNILPLLLYDALAFFLRRLLRVVLQVFLQGHQGVRQTTVLDLAALTEAHEAVARASRAVARGAEARHIAEV